MNILQIAPFDAANAAWHYSEATNAHKEHKSKTLIGRHTNVARHADVWMDDRSARNAVLDWADVLVWHVGLEDVDDEYGGVSDDVPIKRDIHQRDEYADWFHKKPAVFWVNGSRNIRALPDYYRRAWADIPLVATTPDLCGMFEAAWMPVCLPGWLDAGDFTRSRMEPFERLHVVHCPTDKTIKNTADLEHVAQSVIPGGATIHILEGYRYKQCLAYKAACDLHFDHMQGYYGMGSVEALALGLPNLVHLDETNRAAFQEHVGSVPPWLDVKDRAELRLALERAASDRDALAQNGRDSRDWYLRNFTNWWKADRWVQWLEATV